MTPLPLKLHRSLIRNWSLTDLQRLIEDQEMRGQTLGAGVIIKREGWLISAYIKFGERLPIVSIRKTEGNNGFLNLPAT